MFEASVDGVAAVAVSRSPAEAVAWLASLDPAAEHPSTVLSALEVSVAHSAWLASRHQELLAAASANQERLAQVEDPKEYFSDEVAAVLGSDGLTARDRMLDARDLIERLPATLALLEAGAISPAKVRALCEAVRDLPDREAGLVEGRALARCADQTLGQFRRTLTRAVNAVAPKVAERSRAQAVEDRCVRVRPSNPGMSTLYAELPTEDAVRVETALNHYADTHHQAAKAQQAAERAEAERAGADGHRDQDWELTRKEQLRADGLVALADAYLAHPADYVRAELADYAPVPGAIKLRPRIQVTVAASTLLGVDDQPATLTGHGPIPASVARTFAGDANSTWWRIVTDPVGQPIDYGTQRYRPPTNLDRFVRAKYQLCAYPTCSRPAIDSELDHVRAWAGGGATNAENLIPACGRHHHLKHEAGWSIYHDPDRGITSWKTPRGRSYTNYADPLPLSNLTPHDYDDTAPIHWTDAELEQWDQDHQPDTLADLNAWDDELERLNTG